MLQTLKNLFAQNNSVMEKASSNKELFFLCGLMIETASIDGQIDENEIRKIKDSLVKLFKADLKEAEDMVKSCLEKVDEPNSLHFFTSQINKSFSSDLKINLLQILWEIVLIDGKIHDFESNLIRRLAGLMYISDVDCGNAKKIAQTNIKKN